MKKIKFLEMCATIFLTVSILSVFVVVVQTTTNGYVSIAGKSMFRVVTGSMEPTIETGALLICGKTDIEEIKLNDIVCFTSNNQMLRGEVITHRVVDIKNINGTLRLTTQGDANVAEDALYVTESNLLGKVVWYSSESNIIAKVISFMNGKIGFLACIVLPVLLICVFVLRESMNNIQKELIELRRLENETHKKKHQETEEELKARLRKEIRKELGLDEQKDE